MFKQELQKYSHKIESYLAKSNGIGVVQLDADFTILDCNIGFMRLFNLRKPATGERLDDYLELDTKDVRCDEELKIPCSRKTGMNAVNSCYLIQTGDGYLLFCERLLLTESFALEQMGKMNDDLINMQRESVKKHHQLEKLQRELDTRVAELEATLARVKQLEGIIPICMYCKKIRDDQQSWHHLEKYICDHSEAMFSHGVCPTCAEKQMKIIAMGIKHR